MRNRSLFPSLAACIALVFLAASAGKMTGQGEVLITDETPAPAPSTTVTVKPDEQPATTVRVQPAAPAAGAAAAAPVAKPAVAPAAVVALPTNAQDINNLLGGVVRLESQADQVLANQQKIDENIAQLAELIRQARIYASRGGSAPAAP